MTCPICRRPDATIKAVVKRGGILEGCDSCLNFAVQPNELAAQHRRTSQQAEYRQDTVQPFEKNYVKAVGIDKAREMGWDDASIRKHS